MEEYKSRLSDYLSDMVKEELEKYDGGFTDEWNDQRKKNAEVLGYKLAGKSDIKEGATEFWMDMFRPGPIPKKYINQLIKKKGELPSKSHIKKIYRDNGNPRSSELAKTWKQLTKEKYVRAASGMWRWNKDFTGWESVNEARSTDREWNKFEKAFGDFFTTVLRLGKANTKVTGDKTDEKIFIKNFNRDVGKFYSLMQSWVRGQNESVKDCCSNCNEGKVCCKVHEKISKEEWAEYPKYARKLKPYMKRLLKIPVKVRVIKQANHNPWIEVRVARFGKDVIPNDFRKRALKVTGGGRPRDMDNIHYGNITAGSVSMKHDQWAKLLGNKVR